MKADYICENLLKTIKEKNIINGHIHSVFQNACNIETDYVFLTLINSRRKIAPHSIVIGGDKKVNFNLLGIKQKDEVIISEEHIWIEERNIAIKINEAEIWRTEAVFPEKYVSEEELLSNINVLEHGLRLHGKFDGISPVLEIIKEHFPDIDLKLLGLYCDEERRDYKFIESRFVEFVRCFVNADIEEIALKAEKIIGFGKGLTPGMDDFITGLMISLIYLSNYYKLSISKIYEFNKEMIKSGKGKTTKVSSEMLIHASKGQASEAVRELMAAIMTIPSKEKIIKALLETIDIGETSGTDTALGIYLGCKILANSNNRRVWVNEALHRHQKEYIL